jgi:hypothetical protein
LWFCERKPRLYSQNLKVELNLDLNHSRGSIAPQAGPQDAGWRVLQIKDLPESRVRDSVIWQAKIGMVEEVKKLQAHAQLGTFPAGFSRFL